MQTKTVEAIVALLNAHADNPDHALFTEACDLSEYAIKEGVVDWYVGGGYTVPDAEVPVVPEAPVVIPEMVEAITRVLNYYVKGKHIQALNDSIACLGIYMERAGLLVNPGGRGYHVPLPEAQFVPVEWLGDDFDI